MSRAWNFSAGPAALPQPVLEELQGVLLEFSDCRAGLMEISHRSPQFSAVVDSATARMRRVLGVPDDYEVVFQQGGASMQFYAVPLNLCGPGEPVALVDTGTWTSKAVKEAGRVAEARVAWSGKDGGYTRLPGAGDFDAAALEGATYLHYCTNNTIRGTQFQAPPDVGLPLVADLSSDIASKPYDIGAHDVVFAGAQKNLGPSGVTALILSPWAIERSKRAGASRPGGLPSMLDHALQASKDGMFNTPNTWGIYALDRVLAWVESEGGVEAMAVRNTRKADTLYAELDRTEFWRPHVSGAARSQMNVVWRLPSEDLEARFLSQATAAGLLALKGHRSVGGIRASLYNAVPVEAVDALVSFMREFERANG
jgi:phosphoserine aminotransferase